jgi:hypothetical protein
MSAGRLLHRKQLPIAQPQRSPAQKLQHTNPHAQAATGLSCLPFAPSSYPRLSAPADRRSQPGMSPAATAAIAQRLDTGRRGPASPQTLTFLAPAPRSAAWPRCPPLSPGARAPCSAIAAVPQLAAMQSPSATALQRSPTPAAATPPAPSSEVVAAGLCSGPFPLRRSPRRSCAP